MGKTKISEVIDTHLPLKIQNYLKGSKLYLFTSRRVVQGVTFLKMIEKYILVPRNFVFKVKRLNGLDSLDMSRIDIFNVL